MSTKEAAPPTLTPAELAHRVKEARTALSLTQVALAQRASLSVTGVVARMESGQAHGWEPTTLAQIALALNKSWDYLGAAPAPRIAPGTAGYKLCSARLAKGWTILQLAATSGIRQDTISRLERGTYRGQIDTWQTLAQALGITLNDLAPEGR